MLEKIITIYPAILDDQSNLVEQAHNLGQNESQQQIPTVAMSNTCNRQNNLLSKHQRHTDCFNSVSSEAINYILNLLMLSTTTLTAARQRQTALFILSSRVLCSERRRVYFSCFASPSTSVFSSGRGAAKVPPPSPGNFTASVLSLCLLIYPCGKEWW